jgi:serpin B
MATSLSRRDLIRSLSLAVLAVGAVDLLGGCSSDDPDSPRPDADGGVRLVSADVDRAAADPTAIPAAVASLHFLGSGLFARLSGEPGNVAVSPYSVAVALAMTADGAVGRTRDEMLAVLAADSTDRLDAGLNALTQHVESLAGPQERGDGSEAEIALDAANAIFGERTETWEQPFLETLAASYGAGLQAVDFKNAAEDARVLINAWVAERTHDRIDELIAAGLLDTMTRLVLVNALYLKAPWEEPFEKGSTQDGDFDLGDETIRVPMMHGYLDAASYAHGDGWRAVRMPYAGGDLAMTVVLPDDGREGDVGDLVDAGGLVEVLAAPEPVGLVDLTLPRWTFRTQASLADTLDALGMRTAFTPDADFSGMTHDEPLFVSAVVHEVFIAVDEEGTEAAAATAVVMEAGSAPAEPVTLVVDRPFLFVIHDVEHGTPLFLGRVSDPRG